MIEIERSHLECLNLAEGCRLAFGDKRPLSRNLTHRRIIWAAQTDPKQT